MIENRILVRRYCHVNGEWLWMDFFDEGKERRVAIRDRIKSSRNNRRLNVNIAEEERRLLAAGWIPIETEKHYAREFRKAVRVIRIPMEFRWIVEPLVI